MENRDIGFLFIYDLKTNGVLGANIIKQGVHLFSHLVEIFKINL